MFHQGSTLVAGDAHKFLQQADNYKDVLKQVKKHVIDNTNIPSELYDKHKADDWFFNTKQAMKYGIIDGLFTTVNGEEPAELEVTEE